jgi:protein TonB
MERVEIDETVVIENQKSDSKKKATESSYASQAAQARFPGGDLEMYKFIEKSKQYTEAMIEEDLKGVVVVSFEIDKNGKVSKVKSGQQGRLAQDAVQVIESMPKWEPAKKANGSMVKSKRVVTIRYGE